MRDRHTNDLEDRMANRSARLKVFHASMFTSKSCLGRALTVVSLEIVA